MKRFTSKSQKTGQIGEDITVKLLKKHEFRIIERNYTKKWGEIDIIAQLSDKLHFIEVKSVRDGGFAKFSRENNEGGVSYENSGGLFRAEQNVHPKKLERISRTVETYLAEKGVVGDWVVDLYIVYIDFKKKNSKVKIIENIL